MTVQKKNQKKVPGKPKRLKALHKKILCQNQVRSKGGISAWERVLLSRKTDRPVGTDYVNMLFSDLWNFMETGFLETILQWQEELQCSGTFRSR